MVLISWYESNICGKYILLRSALLAVLTLLTLYSLPYYHYESVPVYAVSAWSCFYFAVILYILFVFSTLLYLIPNVPLFSGSVNSLAPNAFFSLEGLQLLKLIMAPLLAVFTVHFCWSGPAIVAWFSHIVFSNFQFKMTYLAFFSFFFYLFGLLMTINLSSIYVFDFLLTVYNFFIWVWLMFFSNNFFTFIFFVELMSTLVTLLLVTSTFTSTSFYNTSSHWSKTFYQNTLPTSLLKTVMFFFWLTLLASLLLFLFCLSFYVKFLTFDWYLVDILMWTLISRSTLAQIAGFSFIWLLFLNIIFLKCGIVPFYVWKPSFFKGMTFPSLFFYITFYYFLLFFFLIFIFFSYFNELMLFNLYLLVWLLVFGTLLVSTILLESYNLKAFLAISSILNSLLIFYALISLNSWSVNFLL